MLKTLLLHTYLILYENIKDTANFIIKCLQTMVIIINHINNKINKNCIILIYYIILLIYIYIFIYIKGDLEE